MKKQFTNLIKTIPLLIATVAVFIMGALVYSVLFAAAGINMAATGGGVVEGTVTKEKVDTTQPDLNLDYVSQKITEMRPASVPLDTIFRSHARKVDVDSIKTNFYAVDIKPFGDTSNGLYTNPGTAKVAEVGVDNIAIWNVDDTILFPDLAGSDGNPLVGAITAKNVGGETVSFQVLNGNGAGTDEVPNIADETLMVRMAIAGSETDMQTAPFAVLPEKEYNYCQNFMGQIEQSTFQRIHDQEVNWGFSDYDRMNLYDMRARKELSYLFGSRKKITDATDAEVKYMCGGLIPSINKGLTWDRSDGISNSTFTNWTKNIFGDNAGSDSRFGFIGDDLMEALTNVDIVNKQLNAKSTEVKWGITFNVIETNFGKLYIKRHPLFRLLGNYKYNGLVIDVDNIEEHTFKKFEAMKLDLKKAGTKNVDATVLQEVACPILRYPATHALITSVA